jgi:YggT family protein
MGFLAGLAGVYSLLIFIRILLTWFSGAHYSRPIAWLARITDPYLNWWRRIPGLQTGFLDLSPIVAISALSLAQSVFSMLAVRGRISAGIMLSIVLSALWTAVSFLLGFCLVVLVLRFIAYMTSRNIYGSFWRIIDAISRPLLYRINRIIFGKRLVNYVAGIITAIAVLAVIWTAGAWAVSRLSALLERLPV